MTLDTQRAVAWEPDVGGPESTSRGPDLSDAGLAEPAPRQLAGRRVAMVVFSPYLFDPRPRRAGETLAGYGAEVEVICLRESDTAPKSDTHNGVSIRRVSIRHHRGGVLSYLYQYGAFLAFTMATLAVRRLTRRYDLIYIHNMPDFLVFGALVPKMLGAKVILDLHDPMPELMQTIFGLSDRSPAVRMLQVLERLSIGFADAAVTVNVACARLFASRSCDAAKVSVVMNSPDESIFDLRVPDFVERSTESPFVVMYHGSMVERNGLDLAVDAFAQALPYMPRAELRIYGSENDYLERVMQDVRSLGLESSVRYMGVVPIDQIPGAIEKCDVGIVPNRKNIFTELNTPTRLFEYLALGKPVIAPRAPGICDYFDEESLVFFELGDARDLATRLRYVFDHPRKVHEIVLRGQRDHLRPAWRRERLKLAELTVRTLERPGRGAPVAPR